MGRTKKKLGTFRVHIIQAEEIVADFDEPKNPEQAECEAGEVREIPGGFFTYSSTQEVKERSRRYDYEAMRFREDALKALK